jgi:hypothetical protein
MRDNANIVIYGICRRTSLLRESLIDSALVGFGVRQHAQADSISKRARFAIGG